jgi:hypothetical protein
MVVPIRVIYLYLVRCPAACRESAKSDKRLPYLDARSRNVGLLFIRRHQDMIYDNLRSLYFGSSVSEDDDSSE